MHPLTYALPFFMRTSMNFFIDMVAPALCASCKQFLPQRSTLCDRCLLLITPITTATITITPSCSMKVFAISDYKDPIKALILGKSFSNIIASNNLGNLIWDLTHIKNVHFDYVVPVPLHWTRFAKRGFNQAEEIAAIIAVKSGKPVCHLLKRIKRTPFQSKVIAHARIGNVADAFALKKIQAAEIYHNKHLLLVDDLSTTGSTLKFAARQLLALKPASITAVVAARVV